jgi:hypothetical protein
MPRPLAFPLALGLLSSLACVVGGKDDTGATTGGSAGTGLDYTGAASCSPQETPDWGIVAQTIPTPNSEGVSPYSPIVVYLLASVDADLFDTDQVTVKMNGDKVDGTFRVITRETTTAFVFVPNDPWEAGSTVSVKIDYYVDTYSYRFKVGEWDTTTPQEAELSFEGGTKTQGDPCVQTLTSGSYTGTGDLLVPTEPIGPFAATDGDAYLLMSTGEVWGNAAIGGTSTWVSTRPLETGGATSLRFDWQFVSEEFDEWVDAVYDDSFMLVLHGPRGVKFREIASVNKVGAADSSPTTQTGLEDADTSGPQTATVEGIDELGSPLVITFLLSDVGDPLYTSALGLDNLVLEGATEVPVE